MAYRILGIALVDIMPLDGNKKQAKDLEIR